jgi:hypothetical protein
MIIPILFVIAGVALYMYRRHPSTMLEDSNMGYKEKLVRLYQRTRQGDKAASKKLTELKYWTSGMGLSNDASVQMGRLARSEHHRKQRIMS